MTIRKGSSSAKQFNVAVHLAVVIVASMAALMSYSGWFFYGGNAHIHEYIMANFGNNAFAITTKILVTIILTFTIPITMFAACETVCFILLVHFTCRLKKRFASLCQNDSNGWLLEFWGALSFELHLHV